MYPVMRHCSNNYLLSSTQVEQVLPALGGKRVVASHSTALVAPKMTIAALKGGAKESLWSPLSSPFAP